MTSRQSISPESNSIDPREMVRPGIPGARYLKGRPPTEIS